MQADGKTISQVSQDDEPQTARFIGHHLSNEDLRKNQEHQEIAPPSNPFEDITQNQQR